jgi:hypothetical protein
MTDGEDKTSMRVRALGLLTIAVILLVAPSVARAQMNVNQYRGLSDSERALYIVGLIDGWRHAVDVLKGLKESDTTVKFFGKIVDCTGPMTRRQVLDIVDKYVQAHPGESNWSALSHAYLALDTACTR